MKTFTLICTDCLNDKEEQNRMKKFMKLIVISLVIVGVLTACAPKAEEPVVEDKLSIAFLINGNLGDKSFFDSAKEGLDNIVTKYGADVKVVEGSSDETKWQPALIDLCEQDYDIIIAGTWQMVDYVSEAADTYPDKKFIVFDTEVAGNKSNVYSITYKQNEGSYLGGYLAAKLSKTGVIGAVGGMNIPVINDFFVGYIEGAQAANPDIKVAMSYIDSFTDSAKGKELALAQFNNNKADVIFQVAGNAGMGVLEAAAEAGFTGIGVDADQYALLTEAGKTDVANTVPTSVLKKVGASLEFAIDQEVAGTLKWGTTGNLGLIEGTVGIAKNSYYDTVVPADLRAELDALEADIASGKIVVSSAFGMTEEAWKAIQDKVQP